MTINAPNFIIHASGSRGNTPDLGKRLERRHCRFTIGAYPSRRQLELATHKWMDRFIMDMKKRGFEYVEKYGVEVTFKGAEIPLMSLSRPKRPPSSREMLPHIMQGAKFRSAGEPPVFSVPHFSQSEYWSYDLSAVFLHDLFWMDVPYPHEEIRPS